MLAQTCSSIGKDTNPSKPIIPPIEKKDAHKDKDSSKSDSPKSNHGDGERSKSRPSSVSDKKDNPTTPRSNSDRSESPKSGFRAPAPKDIPPLVPISSSEGRKSPSSSSHSPITAKSSGESTNVTNAIQHSVAATSSSGSSSSNSRISVNCGNMLLEVSHQEAKSSLAGLASASHPSLGYKPHEGLTAPLPPGYPAYAGCSSLPLLGHPGLSADAATSAAYHAALTAHGLGKGGSLPGAPGAASTLSPYLSYARVKTASGATTLVPVCKDPYCTGCQMTMQSAQLQPTACGAGCTQCTHEKSPLSVPTSLPAPVALGGLPLLPPSVGGAPGASSLSLSSSLYPHFGVLPGHHGLPYVCNWMSGSDYCGKRFTTSEELLGHLRTHTSAAGEAALSALPYSSLGLSLPGLCHSHYSSAGSLSPNSALRQAYPRTLSPNSVLASRYHPYKTPLTLPSGTPGAAALPGTVPPLGAYYSPYALYGQRLGAS